MVRINSKPEIKSYKIIVKKDGSDEWNIEKFYTGGWPIKTLEHAKEFCKKLNKMRDHYHYSFRRVY